MEHPAHRLAGMAADAAEELRGYLAPAVDLPWELTGDDHRDLVPRLYDAVSRLAECIDSIAQAAADQDAKRQLTEGARTILRGCEHVQAGGSTLPGEQRRPGPGATTPPPQLAATDFPQPMTGHLLQAASTSPVPAISATASPARRQAAGQIPGLAASEASQRISNPGR
jgi:hypothetical protein